MLFDKKMLAGGVAMLVTGMALVTVLGSMTPTGHEFMTEDETVELLLAQQENQDYINISGLLIAVGFLLALISFGTRRKGDAAKKIEKKPAD